MSTSRRPKTYWFNDVTISVFDIHTAIDAIAAGTNGFQNRFRFLIDGLEYREAYSSTTTTIETKKLHIRPLGRRVTGIRNVGCARKVKSKFWNGYLQIRHEDTTDSWKQQLPFVVRPKTHVLVLGPSLKGAVANVDAFAYLNTLGWSTNVRVRLQGRFNGDSIVEFINAVSSSSNRPWTVNGSPTTLTGVFRYFQSHLGEEVYSPDRPPDPFKTFPRRWGIALNSYSGPLKPFDSMSDGEKNLFYGILNGKVLNKAAAGSQHTQAQQLPEPILIRENRPENFALIDFNRGILVFPQSDADNAKPGRNNNLKHPSRPLGCHAENTRAFYVMFEMMHHFLVLCDQRQLHGGKFQELQSFVNTNLSQLPQRCWNQLTSYFHYYRKLPPSDRQAKPPVGSGPATAQPQDNTALKSGVNVFLSYSHDTLYHAERVRGLGASLSRDGCECRIDVYKDNDEDWPTWMTRQLLEADFVLCVVTENYERRFRDKELPDQGLGVGWEAGLIRRLLYAKKLRNDRIFPVVFSKPDRAHIPLELQGYDSFLLDGPTGYVTLLRKLLKRPLYAAPVVGTPPGLATTQAVPLFERPSEATSSLEGNIASADIPSTVNSYQSEPFGEDQSAQSSDESPGP